MSPYHVLLVDDDPAILRSLSRGLERSGHRVLATESGLGAIRIFEEHRPDVVILDLFLPDTHGLQVLERLRADGASVILLTGHGDVDTAVQAMQMGAETFLTKPVELDHLAALVERAGEKTRLRQENERLRLGGPRAGTLDALGPSPAMRELARKVELAADSERSTILLTGESGTGKGWLARRIHGMGPRSSGSFVEVNSAALTADSLLPVLLGGEGGAAGRREGLLFQAAGGTLFLDEVADLDPGVQPRLGKLLETRNVRRLGGTRDLDVDVRFIAATHRDLREEVSAGRFRQDLLYRLDVATIYLPPLRRRSPEDRLTLLHRLLGQLRSEIPGAPPGMDEEAVDLLLAYPWPGNIREMRNVLERALLFGRGVEAIAPEHLPPEIRGGGAWVEATEIFRPRSLEEVERQEIARALRHHEGNRTRAARDLGIARSTLIEKIRRHGLDD
jgi:two-component system, NtrC family, response regulator AtoC